MSGEEKIYTKGEMELLLATGEVKTMQRMMRDDFAKHMSDDEEHFERIYLNEKEIEVKIDNLPSRIAEASEKLKTDVMAISRREFTQETDFQVFKTKIMTGVIVGIAAGSVIATIVSIIISSFKVVT